MSSAIVSAPSAAQLQPSKPPSAPAADAQGEGGFAGILEQQQGQPSASPTEETTESPVEASVEQSEGNALPSAGNQTPQADLGQELDAILSALGLPITQTPESSPSLSEESLSEFDEPEQELEAELTAEPMPFTPLSLPPSVDLALSGDPVEQVATQTTLMMDAAIDPKSAQTKTLRPQGREAVDLHWQQASELAGGNEEGLQQELRQGLTGGLREQITLLPKGQGESGNNIDFQQLLGRAPLERPMGQGLLPASSSPLPLTRPLEIPVGQQGWDQGLGERLQWMVGNGLQRAEVRLNPQHLGPLEIRVAIQNDQTHVTILAQHAVTREAVEAGLPRLKEMMGEANINLGNLDVGRREPETQQRSSGGGGQSSGFFAQSEEEPLAEVTSLSGLRRGSGLLDDFA